MNRNIQNFIKTQSLPIIGLPAAGALALLTLALLCPISTQANATDTATAYITAEVTPAIAVSLQNNIDINVTPESTNGTFTSTTAKLKISTNSDAGYKVYMSTIDGTSDLTNTDASKATRITSISKSSTQAQFGQNTWGYAVGESAVNAATSYLPIPTSANSPIITRSTARQNDEYNLTFATNVDLNLPTGTYTNAVTVSAVANPVTVTGLQRSTYMQNMNSAICTNTAEGITKQLIDTRDGNKYWVAKLKDGNCWMTQNLALDLTSKGLSPQDSNISAEWNSRAAYPPTDTNSIALVGKAATSAATATGSWNMGKVVIAVPEEATLCRNYGGSSAAWSLMSTDNFGEKCAKSGFVDVSGDNWKPTFTARNGSFTLQGDSSGTAYNDTLVAINPNNPSDYSKGGTYDAHYLVGNYYQFNAALAGSVVYKANHNSSESICPKNWKLPNGASAADTLTTSGSYQYLLKQYDLITNLTTGKVSNDSYSINRAPFYFVRNGYANPASSSGYFNQVGARGALWSGTALSNSNGYMALFTQTSLSLSYSSYELSAGAQTGAAVRCLIEGETHPVPTT